MAHFACHQLPILAEVFIVASQLQSFSNEQNTFSLCLSDQDLLILIMLDWVFCVVGLSSKSTIKERAGGL